MSTIISATATDLEALERIREERLKEASNKRLFDKCLLVLHDKGEDGYFLGRTFRVAVLPHPIADQVVRIRLFEDALFDGVIGDFAKRHRVVVWVHKMNDFNPHRPLDIGETWVKVLDLSQVSPKEGRYPISDDEDWLYVPGRWEEALSAAASDAARARAAREDRAWAEKAQWLYEKLFPHLLPQYRGIEI